MYLTHIAGQDFQSFQPFNAVLLLFCVLILIAVIRQEMKARERANRLNKVIIGLEIDLLKSIQNNRNTHKLMSNELEALNVSFSTFKNNSSIDLKDWKLEQLEQAANECSILLKVYQRIWNKL